jgi:hypothetical protein
MDITNTLNVNYITGFLYLIYGIVKITLGLMLINVPYEILLKIPIINLFIPNSDDDTLADNFFEYMLVVFSLYTIMMGLALLDILPNKLRLIIENRRTEYAIFIIIGASLLIFYALVLYTDLPISKQTDDESMYNYSFYGYFGSFSFIIMVAIFELLYLIQPSFRALSFERRALIISGIAILIIFGSGYVIKLYNVQKTKMIEEKRQARLKQKEKEQREKEEKEKENEKRRY